MSLNNGIAESYPLIEFGLSSAACILGLQGRVDNGPNGTVVLNESGRARLEQLTAEYGDAVSRWVTKA